MYLEKLTPIDIVTIFGTVPISVFSKCQRATPYENI